MRERNKNKGFSLVELLVTIGIVVILSVLVVPSLFSTRVDVKTKSDKAAVETFQTTIQMAFQNNAIYNKTRSIAELTDSKSITVICSPNADNVLVVDEIVVKNGDKTITSRTWNDTGIALLEIKEYLSAYVGGNVDPIAFQSKEYQGKDHHITVKFPDTEFKVEISSEMKDESDSDIGGSSGGNVGDCLCVPKKPIIITNEKAASCVEEGYTGDQVCSGCNKLLKRGEVIAKKQHTINVVGRVEANCASAGYSGDSICSVCGYVSERGNHIDIGAHQYETVSSIAATCANAGKITKRCSVCGHTTSEIVAKTEHSNFVIKNKVEATCTTVGYTGDKYCGKCNTLIQAGTEVSATHQYKVTEYTASCRSDGYRKSECTLCGDIKTEFVEKTEHQNTQTINVVAATCTTVGHSGDVICNDCGEIVTYGHAISALNHNYVVDNEKTVAPTCTTLGMKSQVCSICGDEKTFPINATAHMNKKIKSDTVVSATCKEKGYTGDTYCLDCGQLVEHGQETERLSHDYKEIKNVAATCQTTGEIVTKCSLCGDETQVFLPLGEHSMTTTGYKEATCTEDGNTGTSTCSVCNLTIGGRTVKAYGHQYDGVEMQAASCTTAGYKKYDCSLCGDDYVETYDPLGHNTTHVEGRVAATCTEDGHEGNEVCDLCGEVLVKGNKIDAFGHKESERIGVREPNCVSPGHTGTTRCTSCGIVMDAGEEKDPLGHIVIEHEFKMPTCTEVGWYAYETCDREGCNYTTYVEVPADGTHDIIEHEGKDATCTDKGWYPYQTCSRCDYTTYVEIPTNGSHTPGAAATCTTTQNCTICGDKLAEKNPNNHSGSAVNGGTSSVHTKYNCCGATISSSHSYTSKVTTSATCQRSGVTTYSCGCGYSYTQNTGTISHRSVYWYTVPGTCARRSCSWYYCDMCGGNQSPSYGDYGDHSYDLSNGSCVYCGEWNGMS